MFRGMKKLKLLVGISALMMLVLSAGVAHGGGRWSGIDPVVMVDGHKMNILVSATNKDWCELESVDVKLILPQGSDYTFMGESYYGSADCAVSTVTTIVENDDPNENGIYILTTPISFSAKNNTKVDTMVYIDEFLAAECWGYVGYISLCGPLYLESNLVFGGSYYYEPSGNMDYYMLPEEFKEESSDTSSSDTTTSTTTDSTSTTDDSTSTKPVKGKSSKK